MAMVYFLEILGIILFVFGTIGFLMATIMMAIKKNKKARYTAIMIPISLIAGFVILIISGILYGRTDEYKEQMAKKEIKEQESLKVIKESENADPEQESSNIELVSKESIETKNTEESIENQIEKDEISNKVQIAIESIGMNYSQTKSWKKLEDWSSGKRYSFVYNGFGYIVYELGNGEIDSINTEYKRIKIYERGYKPLNYKNFEPDISIIDTLQSDMIQRLSSYIIGKTSIKSKIGSIMYSRIYDYYSISGEVKAKNAVSKKDFTFTADYIVKDGGYECVYLALDGAVAFGSDQTPEIQKEELEQENESGNGETIIISYDKKGQYGQYDLFDGEPYLRYYIPTGSYKVKCNIRGGFYIETIKIHKEDGWETSDIIQQINMSEGEETEITIEDGQCISIIINTEIELIKQ